MDDWVMIGIPSRIAGGQIAVDDPCKPDVRALLLHGTGSSRSHRPRPSTASRLM